MTLKLRYALLMALAAVVSSCGIVRLRNSPLYYAGEPVQEGYRLKDAYESFLEIDGKVESAFEHDVVKVVDSLFRTIPDAGHRAIAGLSIGGIQSAVISAYSVDTFGSVGMLSPCFVVAGLPSRYRSATYGRFPQSVRGQFASSAPEYKIFVGDHDLLKPTTDIYHRRLSRMDCPHDYIVLPGAHQWVMWRVAYADYLEGLFR